jgi:hypothetical protein
MTGLIICVAWMTLLLTAIWLHEKLCPCRTPVGHKKLDGTQKETKMKAYLKYDELSALMEKDPLVKAVVLDRVNAFERWAKLCHPLFADGFKIEKKVVDKTK